MPGEQQGRSARKAAGVFYTPLYIVEYILARTLAKHDVAENPLPRVLDPACGTGNFLDAAYDLLLRMFAEKLAVLKQKYYNQQYKIKNGNDEYWLDGQAYWCRENLHYHIVHNCLFGADIDAGAVQKAQERLQAKNTGLSVDLAAMNLLVCDSLVKWENNSAEAAVYNQNLGLCQQLAAFWQQQYDYVIGNPPYVSFGLNRVGKVPVSQADYLRVNYQHSAQYKLSYYALFFERGILALKPGGVLGYITPDSYLLGRYYSKIREYILGSCCIQELTLVNNPVFNGAVVGIPAITILRRELCEGARAASPMAVQKMNDATVKCYQYPQRYFEQQVYNRFRLFFSDKDKSIIDKLEQAPLRFADVAKIRTGMRSLTVQADIKSKVCCGDTWQPGLVSSAQVLPFVLNYQGDWLDVNPIKLNRGGWDKKVMSGPKIFLRQTGDKLIAVVDRSGYYHLNNIHSVVVEKAEVELDYLAAILNSRLMNFYYQTVTLEKGRTMAQVDIEMVEKLPLIVDKERAGDVIVLARRLAEVSSSASSEESMHLFNNLNNVVYEIYGVADDDVWYIEQMDAVENQTTKVKKCR
ncbi:MAG: type restriction m6 adenine methyltransferase, Alw26I/Eco31I/Esp3I family [Firmicutes bacterium]|nr:type restriction m6 adenine methyltransferase, Alw26I/Eco31I/Esp3I family [Bacillota bacterium]